MQDHCSYRRLWSKYSPRPEGGIFDDACETWSKPAPQYLVARAHMDDSGYASGYEGMKQLLACDPRPDGVFCGNDPIAMGADESHPRSRSEDSPGCGGCRLWQSSLRRSSAGASYQHRSGQRRSGSKRGKIGTQSGKEPVKSASQDHSFGINSWSARPVNGKHKRASFHIHHF